MPRTHSKPAAISPPPVVRAATIGREAARMQSFAHLEGALDVQQAAAHHATLSTWLGQDAAEYTLDLGAVSMCDSAGLQLLCAARRSVLTAGRVWRLVNPSEPVLRACSEIAIPPQELGL